MEIFNTWNLLYKALSISSNKLLCSEGGFTIQTAQNHPLSISLHPRATWASWELTSTLIDWLRSNLLGMKILPNYLRQRMLCRWHWWDNSRSQLWCGWKIHASPSCGRLDFAGSQLPLNLEWSAGFSLPGLRRHEDLLRFPTYFEAILTHSAAWKQNKSDPSSWKHNWIGSLWPTKHEQTNIICS